MRTPFLMIAGGLSLQACGYEEQLLITNLHGNVHIPAESTVRDVVDIDGNLQSVGPDVRGLGPVYLGLYSSISPAGTVERYPYPEIGPQFKEGVAGDAYPYGGTTMGDLRFACLQSLSCLVVSGRYVDYDAMLDWFQTVGVDVLDSNEDPVGNAEFIRQTCFDIFNVNTDREVRLIATDDKNGDGKVDEGDLDFVYDEQANEFVGPFEIRQQEHFYDQRAENCTPGTDCAAMSVWGWMDTPAVGSYRYKTCDTTEGFQFPRYNENFVGGRVFLDVLNFPTNYIETGDYAATDGFEWKNVYDEPEIYLDFVVQ